MIIPNRLAATCGGTPEGRAWLEQLPITVRELQARWALVLEAPFDGDDVSCSWVAPATRSDGIRAILKVGLPHMEAEHEIAALRFWNGDPTVHLLASDDDRYAMLLERCEPGTSLKLLPEAEQDVVVAGLLHRLWRRPPEPHPFRPLATMAAAWVEETLAESARWPDVGLVQEGIRLFEELSRPSSGDVLLATDLHGGNILRAQREPWLAIDPKPFVGDPAYDATQHLFNSERRLFTHPLETIRRFADLLEVDAERVRLWMFARSAMATIDEEGDELLALARTLA